MKVRLWTYGYGHVGPSFAVWDMDRESESESESEHGIQQFELVLGKTCLVN